MPARVGQLVRIRTKWLPAWLSLAHLGLSLLRPGAAQGEPSSPALWLGSRHLEVAGSGVFFVFRRPVSLWPLVRRDFLNPHPLTVSLIS